MTVRGVVVGVNGSAEADEALDWAAREAASRQAPLTVVMVAPGHGRDTDPAALEPVLAPVRDEARRLLEAALARTGVAVEARAQAEPGPAADALLHEGGDADMLVLGRRRRGRFGRRILGSVSTTVVEHSAVPVTVVRHPEVVEEPAVEPDGAGSSQDTGHDAAQEATPPSAVPRIVVGVDTSSASVAALRHAGEVARRTGAVLDAVFAWQITTLAPLPGSWGWAPPLDDYERFAAESLAAAVTAAGVDLPEDQLRQRVVHGQAAKHLVLAAHGARRLVVGARGLGGFDRLLIGSISRQVLDFSPCPVTVVRG